MISQGNVQGTPDGLGDRLYRWSLDDARREIDAGLPWLRSFRSGPGRHAVAELESLPEAERFSFLFALIRRRMRAEAERAGEPLTAAEENRCGRFFASIVFPTPDEQALRDAERNGIVRFRLDRRRFSARIKLSLNAVLGVEPQTLGPGVWRYLNAIRGCTLATIVDVGGRTHQLCYDHQFLVSPKPYRVSFLSWMGVSGQTDWSYLTEADMVPAADTLAELCAHFLRAAPQLL